ncbi:hypothetical protein ANCDUO_13569 [Ancylostoma duodenale]|uniref:Uncharacterized protein n=1 Tax=Ancylostoma duodenale TaxID=51022 RepID=A0A0C2GGM7_9BILA|nr:hypothetical protein ANCDUO_13569 [Ancylostoma duodenale]
MDSPPDLSPNAPPTGFEEPNNYFANLQATPAPPSASSTGQASTEGSVDSSGFEKFSFGLIYDTNECEKMHTFLLEQKTYLEIAYAPSLRSFIRYV